MVCLEPSCAPPVSSHGEGKPLFHRVAYSTASEEPETELCSTTLNLFKFKRRVPWFAPFMNLCTKLTPEETRVNTRCAHSPQLGRPRAASSGRAGRSWAGARLCWTALPGCARRPAGRSDRPERPLQASCEASEKQLSGCLLASRCLAQGTKTPQRNARRLQTRFPRVAAVTKQPRGSEAGLRTPEGPNSAVWRLY